MQVVDPSELVRETRKALGLSQQKLADMAGVSQTTIDKIEKGLIKKSKYIYRIAACMNVPSDVVRKIVSDDLLPEAFAALENKPSGTTETLPLRFSDAPLLDEDPADIIETGTNLKTRLPRPFSIIDVLAHISAPDVLKGIRGAFAFIVPNNCMSPCISTGDTVFVHPLMPRLDGAIYLFTLSNVLDREGRHLIGILAGQDGDAWRATLLNPRQELVLPKTKWSTAERIVATHYRL